MFQQRAINVTTEGHKHLGAVIGSQEYQKDGTVTEWVSEIVKLAKIGTTEPQACYSAYIFGLKRKWNYFLRTVPDTQDLLEPLERALRQILIPTITGHKCSQLERDVLSLLIGCGGSWLWKYVSRACAGAQHIRRNNCAPRRPNHVSTTSIARQFSLEIGKTNFQAQEITIKLRYDWPIEDIAT